MHDKKKFKLILLFENGKIYKYKISTNGEMKHMLFVRCMANFENITFIIQKGQNL